MPHEVKMPQLGMTQDSGIIVSWLKGDGDAVTKGDALFEVETDKATMEVEAQASGFVSGVTAKEGDDVPVGDVIAYIVESAQEVSERTSAQVVDHAAASEKEEEASTQVEAAPAADVEPASKAAPATDPPPATGKILASPKARRTALEKGIDLGVLRAQGVQEPILASDLSKAATGGQSCLTAMISGAALEALLASSDGADRGALFVAFAAGAWREVFHTEAAIRRLSLDGETDIIENEPAALTFVDLSGTRLTSFARAGGGTTLTAAQQGDGVTLTLSFSETSLPITQAVALLDEIAARVEDPIRQIL